MSLCVETMKKSRFRIGMKTKLTSKYDAKGRNGKKHKIKKDEEMWSRIVFIKRRRFESEC